MLTDTELTDALRSTFAEATNTLDPPAGVGSAVRRRHRAARRRRAAFRVTVPAMVAASVAAWVAFGPAPSTGSPAAQGTATLPKIASAPNSTASAPNSMMAPVPNSTPAAYVLDLPADQDVPCLPGVGRGTPPRIYKHWPAKLVLTDRRQDCMVGLVMFIAGFPSNSVPIHRPGLTGLNEMVFASYPEKSIFMRIPPEMERTNTRGGCYVLTISSKVSDEVLKTYFLPALAKIPTGP